MTETKIKYKSKEKTAFEKTIHDLKYLGYEVVPEFKFCPDRKFRADFKLSKKNIIILVEYEGIMASKSRHTSITGFSKDTEKYNLMTKLGYMRLSYTALNYQNLLRDIQEIEERILGQSSLSPACSSLPSGVEKGIEKYDGKY